METATQAVLDATEKSLDEIEETLETIERIPRLNLNGTTHKQQVVILTAMALAGAAAGGTAMYFITKKRMAKKYEQIIEDEVEAAKRFYARVHKVGDDGEVLTPGDVLADRHGEEAVEALRLYAADEEADKARPEGPVPTEEELMTVREGEPIVRVQPLQKNVFTPDDAVAVEDDLGGWDYKVEVEKRFGDTPYIVSEEEYLNNEWDDDCEDMTYYEGDDTLVDNQGSPIPEPANVVGDDCLVKFGYGTKDHNSVYVRNEGLECMFHITRLTSKYAVDVLGFDDSSGELKHSEGRGIRRFRGFDD